MKAVFGGIIAFVLLGLYASSVIIAILLVFKHSGPTAKLPDGVQLAMTTVGALVSSLVISVLAATDAGSTPLVATMTQQSYTRSNITAVQYAMYAYLGTWLVCGLASFVVGVMLYPDVLQSLNDHGKAWIGLAVASGYAYFGLKGGDSSGLAGADRASTT